MFIAKKGKQNFIAFTFIVDNGKDNKKMIKHIISFKLGFKHQLMTNLDY